MKAILILSVLTCFALAAYSEADAKRYVWAASFSYCSFMDTPGACGRAETEMTKLGYRLRNYKITEEGHNEINAAIFRSVEHKEIVIAFSGTKNGDQLLEELYNNWPVPYSLHNLEGAETLEYFLTHYAQFSEWMFSALNEIYWVDEKIVITGHSLGGALAVHAAMDLLLSGYEVDRLKLYTFGQPRVGNQAFDGHIKANIKDAFRIVHWRDQVPHLRPCIPKFGTQSACATSAGSNFCPFHSVTEVFYQQGMDSTYQVCANDEDRKCANQFTLTNWDDHGLYFGVPVGSAHAH